MRRFACGFVLGLFLAGSAWANAPDRSLRPAPNPLGTLQPAAAPAPQMTGAAGVSLQDQAAALLAARGAGTSSSPRPRERPVVRISGASESPQPVRQAGPVPSLAPAALALLSVPRPEPRPRPSAGVSADPQAPEKIQTVAAVRILPGQSAITGKKGSVCGDPSIRGETLAPITSRVRGCGIKEPVRITSVDGVALSQAAVINCDTARALKTWVRKGLKPAFGRKDVVGLRVAASYACRPRNNIRGAKISEHGRGNAIDISAIILADGRDIVVAEDWRRSAGRPMRKAYKAACGPFSTTLGPESDRHHRNHLHFDIASQRGGSYCR
ncbi:MAG: extensin family protein [Rhodobacter sp.]|nr:extensin family protein [Rhodobacter sp.]MCA3512318.1 extensin family protein [Rhodobacter sp.]MCA3520328.1 extensin family protein [Rhodobacter sp.]MCA3521839.1 extensin family protein [Rhodobacter sp.]MCA3525890.1 extensin family protein [Rhodobacter sp.]